MFSIIAPMDTNRLTQFKETKRIYDSFPQKKEFIIPTRNYDGVAKYLEENDLIKDVRLIPYKHEIGFNPSMALNIGVRNAKYDHIIVTSPEVKPKTQVLDQLSEVLGENVICQVWDENADHELVQSLVNSIFRKDDPAMYFLAMFNKSDIEKINGWDEDFMKGYAYEDNDFGARWVRAGLPFVVRDDIQGIHQYHPRSETIRGGAAINFEKFNSNTDKGVTFCENGLVKNVV